MRQRPPGKSHGRHGILFVDLAPYPEFGVLDGFLAPTSATADVVDEDLHSSPFAIDDIHHTIGGVCFKDVGDDRKQLHAIGLQIRQSCIQPLLRTRANGDVASFRGQPPGRCQTDAVTAAGHQGEFPGKSEIHLERAPEAPLVAEEILAVEIGRFQAEHVLDGMHDRAGVGIKFVLELAHGRARRMGKADALYRRLELAEALLVDARRQLGAEAAVDPVAVGDDAAARCA